MSQHYTGKMRPDPIRSLRVREGNAIRRQPGAGFFWRDLAVLTAWGIGGLILGLRFFRWDAIDGIGLTRDRREEA